MSSLTIQSRNPIRDEIIPKPAWPVRKPALRIRIARLLQRAYGTAAMLTIHR